MNNTIIEDKNFLSKDQKLFFENVIFKDSFPFYYNNNSVQNDNEGYLAHILLNRLEDRKTVDEINSPYFDFFKEIFDSFCKKNNVEYKQILRMAVNLSIKGKKKESVIHRDHDYNSNHLIVYLSDLSDDIGYTYIYDDDKKTLLHKVKPELFKGVCFGWKHHSAEPPPYGRRMVVVYTFI